MRKTPAAAVPQAVSQELLAEFAATAEQIGCELAHIAFQNRTLRIVLDRLDGAVTIDDCATVSRQISALLDVSDAVSGKYTLEVTSPGLDRELYGPRDYERFKGSLARITFRNPESGAKQTLVGRLAEFETADTEDASVVSLLVEGEEQPRDIALRDIKLARLEIEL